MRNESTSRSCTNPDMRISITMGVAEKARDVTSVHVLRSRWVIIPFITCCTESFESNTIITRIILPQKIGQVLADA